MAIYTPTLVGSIQGAGDPNYLEAANSVAVSGDYAYVVACDDNALTIIDISTPATPTFVGSIQGSGSPNYLEAADGVAVSGNYAYVVACRDNSLTIITTYSFAPPVASGTNFMKTNKRLVIAVADKIIYEEI